MPSDQERNRLNAVAFCEIAYLGKPREAADLYPSGEYIQHNSLVGEEHDIGVQCFR